MLQYWEMMSGFYVNDAGDLIGVGSLGDAQASWPTNSKPREPAACITWLGIDRRFQKKGFGQQILDDLLNYVYSTTSYRLVTLVVHVDNKPAHEWYRKNNFTTIGKPFTLDGHSYQRMVINIRQDK